VTVRVNEKKSEIYAFFFAEISIKVTADKVLSWRMILGVIRSLLIARMSVCNQSQSFFIVLHIQSRYSL